MKIDKFLTLENAVLRYEDTYENGFSRNFYFTYQDMVFPFKVWDGFKYDLGATISNNLKCLNKRTLCNVTIRTYYNRKYGYFVNSLVIKYQDFFDKKGKMIEVPIELSKEDYKTLVALLIC